MGNTSGTTGTIGNSFSSICLAEHNGERTFFNKKSGIELGLVLNEHCLL
jgi:hypothetical protein